MYYESALHFLIGTLHKCAIPTHTVFAGDILTDADRAGFRFLTGNSSSVEQVFGSTVPTTVYTLTDRFGCNYIYFRLPDTAQALQVIGPYVTEKLSAEAILALSEQLRLCPSETASLRSFLSAVPLLPESSPIYLMLEQFYETLWPAGYAVVSTESPHDLTVIPKKEQDDHDNLWNARILEYRYAMENNMMTAVTQGQLHKVDRAFSQFPLDFLEERTTDTLRNTKNYGIILNTLLRKAAEQGGVHPFYIDRLSTDFAIRIENLSAVSHTAELMREMVRGYCRLVQTQKTANYPPLVQKAILLIDEDLSGDLNLRKLAEKLNTSSSYLSTLFKKETDRTVTKFITDRRIHLAKHLLKTTSLQVQTIAQHCGFPDVNYFSKIFKKVTSVTPKAYRAEG